MRLKFREINLFLVMGYNLENRISCFVDDHPIKFGLLIFTFCAFVVTMARLFLYNYLGEFGQGIIVESTGMLLDILVFGVLVLWFNKLAEKKQLIKRYNEEIEDYLDVESEEARAIILSRIRRLNNLGVAPISLSSAFLKSANLSGANLAGTDLKRANLENACLLAANLRLADLRATNLKGADLSGAHLSNQSLQQSNYEGADIEAAVTFKEEIQARQKIFHLGQKREKPPF